MGKLKGVKKLNKAITKKLKPFGIKKARLNTTYAYYFDKKIIDFKITQDSIEDIMFSDFIYERFGYEVKYPFAISILHELGHHLANDDILGTVYAFCLQEKDRIEKEMDFADAERSRQLNYEYFNLPDELMATQWAVGFAKKYPKAVIELEQSFEKALKKFYKANKVTD